MTPTLRPATRGDIDAMVALNAPVQAVTAPMDAVRCGELLALAPASLIAEAQGAPLGFVLVMHWDAAHANDNFDWFAARLRRFAYVDRIVVAAQARGTGLGAALYARAAEQARAAGCLTLAAEIDCDPPNPGSLAFHAAQGFAQLGTRRTGAGKTVSMQIKGLTG